ncbi:MAG: T9SS type A sorting domain-containing protein [Fluviicola sp.]|nr:T9SS type A sorting domain-containing protein [Fluviicola sp.]
MITKFQSYLILIFCLFAGNANSQNLIENHNFEQRTSDSFTYWGSILTVDGIINLPEQMLSPLEGNWSVGLRFISFLEPDWQEYIFQPIDGDLTAGSVYEVSLTYRLNPRSKNASDDLGIAFIKDKTFNEVTSALLAQTEPQVRNPENHMMINNTTNGSFHGYYTATGNEDFIAIGCFKTDATLTKYPVQSLAPNPNTDVYYIIDEVIVRKCPHFYQVNLPEEVTLCDDSTAVSMSFNILNSTYLWSNGSTASSTVIPYQEGPMWVQVKKFGCVISDTMQVHLFSGKSDLGEDQFRCSDSEFPIELTAYKQPFESIVWDNGSFNSKRKVSDPGTYWYTKTSGSCVASDTIIIQSFLDDFLLYPNPVTEELHSTFPAETEVLRLVDELGRVLFEGNESLDGIQPLILSLPSAMYFIEVSVNGCRDLKVIEKVNRLE